MLDRLHKDVQRAIYKLDWKNFRPIQERAIKKIIDTSSDVIISAPTASGKTEAAFIPILSLTAEETAQKMAIMYVSPLKALINDQFKRASELCEEMDVTITKWHGDASYTKKKHLLNNPKGILLITPESIEAMLIKRENVARALFQHIKFIIIDELHVFLGQERGEQLRSLLARIDNLTGCRARRVCLSATLGDSETVVKCWLAGSNDADIEVISDSDKDKEKIYSIQAFNHNSELTDCLFDKIKHGLNLIFGNSKKVLEESCDAVKKIAKKRNYPDNFYIHHGSLSKEIREEAEQKLKNEHNLSVFCTSTLELGIDIGNVDKVILLDPPWSVAAFRQRIGRSGRKQNMPIDFEFVINTKEVIPLLDTIKPRLVKAVALTELMQEDWCEPAEQGFNDYSVYFHQLLAYIRQRGGINSAQLYEQINQKSFLNSLNDKDFNLLLQHLDKEKIIEKISDGSILLGEKGELLVDNYKFYAVFKTSEQWKIKHRGKEIGEVPFGCLFHCQAGDDLLLAGRRWTIISADERTKLINVDVSQGLKPLLFRGTGGIVAPEIHQKMLFIYRSRFAPEYLSPPSKQAIREAFAHFATLGEEYSNFLPVFMGTKVQNTVNILLKSLGVQVADMDIGFGCKDKTADEVMDILIKNKDSLNEAEKILHDTPREKKEFKKYDEHLPEWLLNRSYIANFLDFNRTNKWLDSQN